MFAEQEKNTIEMSKELFESILDNSLNEVYVLDGDMRVVFMNKICEQHYGFKRSEIIGVKNEELFKQGYWTPSVVPIVFKEKQPVTIRQTTFYGGELITTAVPILDKKQEIKLVVITAHEPNYTELTLTDEENMHDKHLPIDFITNSQKMKELLNFCQRVSSVDSTILLQGESGTGKGALAKFIHQASPRKNGPLLTINCAAIPEELLESELFGYTQGAFTGASKTGKIGLIEAADQGTLFLDEIGEIPLKIQAKLLQVIQDHQFLPIGGTEIKEVNVRIIAATNRDLLTMIEKKQFREDLYYRLNVIDVKIPPLRERREDIIPLTYYFINKFNKKYEVDRLIAQDTLEILASYSWPGNVRQLENMMERLIITTESIINPSDLPGIIHQFHQDSGYSAHQRVSIEHSQTDLDAALEELEKQVVIQSYKRMGSSRKVAADLNISQTRANKLIQKYITRLL